MHYYYFSSPCFSSIASSAGEHDAAHPIPEPVGDRHETRVRRPRHPVPDDGRACRPHPERRPAEAHAPAAVGRRRRHARHAEPDGRRFGGSEGAGAAVAAAGPAGAQREPAVGQRPDAGFHDTERGADCRQSAAGRGERAAVRARSERRWNGRIGELFVLFIYNIYNSK